MMRECSIAEVRHLFEGPEMALLIKAVEAGNAGARCWLSEDDQWALLWDRCNNVLYVGGQPERDALGALLGQVVHVAAAEAGRPFLRGRGMDEHATQALAEALAGYELFRGPHRFYAYTAPTCDPGRFAVPAGVQIVPITRAQVEDLRPAGVDEVEEELTQMWPSLEAFYSNGFGFAALADGAVACWCTTEYMSGDHCGIGIATAEAMRRRGIAAATAVACVAEALRRGVMPHWECAGRNVPSVRLAEKLGFDLLGEREFLYWQAGAR